MSVSRPPLGESLTDQLQDAEQEVADMYSPLNLDVGPRPTRRRKRTPLSSPTSRRFNTAVKILQHPVFEIAICAVIFMNIAVIWFDENRKECFDASQACDWSKFDFADPIVLSIFVVELAVRVYVDRNEFFSEKWNRIDTAIVVLGFGELILFYFFDIDRGIRLLLTLVRLVRLGRFLHLLSPFPILYMMLRSFGGISVVMLWGSALILALLFIWSLLALAVLRPINRHVDHSGNEWCSTAFTSVRAAML